MTIPGLPEFNLIEFVQQVSYIGIFFIVFAESGMFFGFFFPGDSLLFTAGFLASQHLLNIYLLVPLIVIAAILGDSAGYWIGRKFGNWLMRMKDSWYFKKQYVHEAEKFYQKHGGKTIVLARFVPIVRTFAPIVAGMAKMDYGRFLSFNIFGGLFWGAGMTLAGYFLGSLIPNVDKYLLPIVALIIFLSILPGLFHIRNGRRKAKANRSPGVV